MIEIERAQIGHEIHDSLLPLIFAASAGVQALADDLSEEKPDERSAASDPTGRLKQIAGWLDDAMQTGRRLLSGVYPPELTGANWTATASMCAQRLVDDESLQISWDVDPEINQIDPNLAVAGYRIVVESIRNAARHGKASRVDVKVAKDQDHWTIEITDDGDGFDPTTIPEDRFGIRSMIGRAELAGGTLNLQSQPGGPTTVTFQFPQTSAISPKSNR